MKNLGFISGIILFLFGLGICLKSLTYPIGSFQSPGGGLFPLLASILLMVLAVVMSIQTLFGGEGAKGKFFPAKESPKRIFLGLLSLVGFRYLLPVIGFGPSTFVFILFLSKVLGDYGWRGSLFISVLTALTSYFLFQVFLKVPMPRTLLGF
jgi:putative tricarboxylic transport membrane protein